MVAAWAIMRMLHWRASSWAAAAKASAWGLSGCEMTDGTHWSPACHTAGSSGMLPKKGVPSRSASFWPDSPLKSGAGSPQLGQI